MILVPGQTLRGWGWSPCLVLALIAPLLAGCSETTSTSSSDEKATVKGVVTLDGKAVGKGTITFDPSNINRRMASVASSPINPDGSYTVTTLTGRNIVSFDLPGLATPKNQLNYSRLDCELKPGENTFEAALTMPKSR